MAARSLEIGPAGIRTARTIEIIRTERGLAQRQLADRVTALGRPMSNTMLSRIERAQRRCDVDDLVVIAEALYVSPLALLEGDTALVT
ncbi:helix-turn-helix domain-containing protein [Streptomyces mirabilis]|uniref:helix-turn-helix domain-containing protein n=1 Tax=Streptomyces mirabilis TaxID=68239 RepID=UPI0036CF96A5